MIHQNLHVRWHHFFLLHNIRLLVKKMTVLQEHSPIPHYIKAKA